MGFVRKLKFDPKYPKFLNLTQTKNFFLGIVLSDQFDPPLAKIEPIFDFTVFLMIFEKYNSFNSRVFEIEEI